MKTKIILIAAAALFAGCSGRDPDLVPQPNPVVYNAIHESSTQNTITADPQVDVLFVIDDSLSMDKYQERLKANVHAFVSAFATANKAISFQIGVTQIWDSHRYSLGIVQPTCKLDDGSIHTNYIAPGALLPLKAPSGQTQVLSQFTHPIITDKPGYEAVLEQSLAIGVQGLIKNKKNAAQVCESGPEVEEILTPIWFSFQPSTVQNYNTGFWRPNSLKVFIVLSDAKEGSSLHADYVDAQIRSWLGAPAKGPQNKYRVYLAGMVPGTRVTSDCKPDPGFGLSDGAVIPQHEIANLVSLSGGKMFNICLKNYGQDLANFGDDVKKATLPDKRQKLSFQPDMNSTELPAEKRMQLKLNGNALTQGSLAIDTATGDEKISGGDWAFDSEHNEAVVRGSFWADHPKAVVEINYVPVTDPGAKAIN